MSLTFRKNTPSKSRQRCCRYLQKTINVMTKNFLFVLLLVCTSIIGCGKGFVPAGGKVTYEDGSPVTSGGIVFSSSFFMAEGRIQSDGTYTLFSLKPGDGLPPGQYKVTIGASETDERERSVDLIDPKFSDPKSSPLFAEVIKGGTNQFDFQVTKPGKK